jgi:pimeloyl-ACP methyl ester carboxylesterase
MALEITSPSEFIKPLTVRGLSGRVLDMPAIGDAQKRNLLFVYGQHSSLERWWGLIQTFNKYGNVTVPDLPGYGGMDSLYKIGKEPNFDELADYLADFIRQHYKDESETFSILGLSIGFAITTRMLQRHPNLQDRVVHLVSVVGFAHHDDFVFRKRRQRAYKYGSWLFLHWPLYVFIRRVVFSPWMMRRFYSRTLTAREKFEELSGDEFNRTMDMELSLWEINDLRTWMRSNIEMFNLNNCRVKVQLPVLHLSVRKDRYFSLKQVEKHYRQIFTDYRHVQLPTDSHAPSVIASPDEAALLIPKELGQVLST